MNAPTPAPPGGPRPAGPPFSWLGRALAAALCAAGLAGLVAARPGAVVASVVGWIGMSGQTMASALALLAGLGVWVLTGLRRENARLEAAVAARTRELAMSEAKFRGIFEGSVEGIFQSSPEGRSLVANPAMARLCGYGNPDEMTGAITDLETQFYATPGRRREINVRLEREGTLVGVESEVRRRDGTTFWASENICVVRDPETGRSTYLGSLVDVTERRAAAERTRETMRAVEAADRAKSEFLSRMSHELRTPLNGILGYARLLARDAAADVRLRERLGIIETSGEHLLALINEVLDYSKIEAGKVELHPGPCHLPGLLMSLGDIFSHRAAERGLAFRAADTAQVPRMVRADEAKLRQVLFNLLGNAVKFTDAGSVELRVGRVRNGDAAQSSPPAVPPSAFRAPHAGGGGALRFEVLDTGIGIAADQLRDIFLPFHQAVGVGGGGAARAAQGTGLGLSISERLVRLMGGELRVESAPGAGSRFSFDLDLPEITNDPAPDGAGRSLADHPPPAVTGYLGPRRRVLVVDDEPVNRQLAAETLANLGFLVSEAAGGEECLREWTGPAATPERPDLVLLDLRMAPMDGLETARRLRTIPGAAGVKILASTAGDTLPSEKAARAAGCDDFLPKPVNLEKLMDVLARLLDLEWTRAEGIPHANPASAAAEGGGEVPGREELDALLALAMQGDVLSLRTRLRESAARRPECAAFFAEIERLAAGFQLGRTTEVLRRAGAGAAISFP